MDEIELALNEWKIEVRAELERRKYDRGEPDNFVNSYVSIGLELSLAIMNQKLHDFIDKGK